jgi:RNA polymerase sigma-70 factor (ECF subfamily)
MTHAPPELTTGPRRAALVDDMRRDYPRVVASVALVAGDRDGAEDAVQDAVAALWQRTDGFRPDNVAAWVTVAAANRCRTAHRRRGAESRALERLGLPPDHADDAAASIGDATALAAALRRLPERQRRIAVLHYVGDHSVATIASVLGVSEGTVKTQLSRARATLAAALREADGR